MVVYWDALAVWNFMLDYLLLYGAQRLAGRHIERRRLFAAAVLGAVYAVVCLLVPHAAYLALPALAGMCRVAFGRTALYLRLTLLAAGLGCAFAGAVLLLGRCCGSMERLAFGVLRADIPWGVFLLAAGLSYLAQAVVFRGAAKRRTAETVRVTIGYGGKSAALRLLSDTGNVLHDPQTGLGVPVVTEDVLQALGVKESDLTRIGYRAVGVPDGTLRAFRCDALSLDGEALAPRLVAVTDGAWTGGVQGLWCAGAERGEERAVVG